MDKRTHSVGIVLGAGLKGACLLCLVAAWAISHASAEETKKVDSSLGLWEALQQQEVTTIHVTKDLLLERDVWPGDDMVGSARDYGIPVTRNLTIKGYSEDGDSHSIDFDYMRFRVGIGDGVKLVLRGLRLLGSARDPEEQLVFVFFAFGINCALVYEDVIAEIAVDYRRSLGRMARLETLPRVGNETNPDGTPKQQELEILPDYDPLCHTMSGQECMSGAIAFEDFSNVVILTNRQTLQEWKIRLSISKTLLMAVDVSEGWPKSREETAGKLTVVVQKFVDLALAIRNPHVETVHLWRDLVYDMSSWPNFDGYHRLNCILDRNLSIQTHPLSLRRSGMATLDFNFAKHALQITQESTLTLHLLLLDRTCRFRDPQCPLPFFDVMSGSQIVVKSGYMRVAVSATDFDELDEAPQELLPSPSPISWRRVVDQITRFDECNEVLRRPCDRLGTVNDLMVDGALFTQDAFDEDLGRINRRSSVLLSNLTLILFDNGKHKVLQEEEIVFQKEGILSVFNEVELHQAMRNKSITGVYLTSNLNISGLVWPQDEQIILGRSFYMTTHPSSPVAMVVDLNFLSNRVLVQTGQTLSLEWMNFTRVSNNGDNMHYIPFFAWQDNTTIFLKDVLAQMAIEPSRCVLRSCYDCD